MIKLDDIFKKAVDQGASDVHLVAGLSPVFRVDGELVNQKGSTVLSSKEIEEMVFAAINEEQKQIFKGRKEFDFGYESEDKARFRVNLHFEKGNIGLVARVISEKVPTLEEIGMPQVVYELLKLNQGLVLVTGPTGCGKSTTLAAMINYINQFRRCSIITLEDPVEYLFKPDNSVIIQRQLASDMHTFGDGLKHVLRQDPNVIMVGEMRDLETIAATITLAETGHLVLATLHTYSAAQTIDRIIDIFPPHQQNQVRIQLSMTLAAIVSQRLILRIGNGRIAAREVLLNTPAVSNLIRENKIAQIKTVIETSAKEGMVTMDHSIKELFEKGIIEKEIAQSYMEHPDILEKFKIL